MPYCIKVAISPTEVDAVLRLRYDVFVKERGFMAERRDRRVYDHYDVLPTTANLLAQVDGRPVGTLRFTAPSEVGTSPDSYFDFTPHLPVPLACAGALSQMVIRGKTRRGSEIAYSLLGLSYCLAAEADVRYLEAVVNPDALARMFVTSGWVAASEIFTDGSGLQCLPLTLDLNALHDRFKDFVAIHRGSGLPDGAEFRFYARNESISPPGDPSDTALSVVDGTVALRTEDGDELGHLEAGARLDENTLASGAVALAATSVAVVRPALP